MERYHDSTDTDDAGLESAPAWEVLEVRGENCEHEEEKKKTGAPRRRRCRSTLTTPALILPHPAHAVL
jgi:hypothetical protein